MKFKDYYQTLGVERTASDAEIKKAYRKLAHQYHPDVSKDPAGEDKFKEIAEAYATLKDPEKRAEYDRLGQRPAGQDFSPPPEWEQRFGGGGDSAYFDDVDLADILSAFGRSGGMGGMGGMGSGRRQTRGYAGQDYEVVARVTLEQVYRGDQIEVRVELPETDARGLPHRVPRTFQVTLPKGAQSGQRLRLPGKGGAGVNGGKPGDLYVVIDVAPHPLYRVSGRDLFIDLPLAPWEAALGATVELPTLAGVVELTVSPGTSSGKQLRLAGRGMPAPEGAGDLFAVVRIEVPKSIGSRERELFRELGQASGFNPRAQWSEGTQRAKGAGA
jgi:curved DNA-binding protein